jgi:hypothetical protein
MSSADLATWLVAGDYVAKSSNTHAFNVGMTYGSQGIPAGARTPIPVTALFSDGARNAGQIYAFDRWRLSPMLLVDYGTRIDYWTMVASAAHVRGAARRRSGSRAHGPRRDDRRTSF